MIHEDTFTKLVNLEAVEHDMNLMVRRASSDGLLKELHNLLTGVTWSGLADDLTRLGCKQDLPM